MPQKFPNLDENNYSPLELLQLHGMIIKELQRRGICRTENPPVGDFAEWLVCKGLGLDRAEKKTKGYDATEKNNDKVKYQIKSRHITSHNKSKELGAVRDFESQPFSFLIAVIFNEDYSSYTAYKIPFDSIKQHYYSKRANATKIHANKNLIKADGCEDIKKKLDKVLFKYENKKSSSP